jgi:hypothetical protein
MRSTYSFSDLAGVISHPTAGSFVFTGQGAGEVHVNMVTERSTHDVAADGSIMVSKISGNNGSITINVQQTSDLHLWLLRSFNLLWFSDANMWAVMGIKLRNVRTGTSHLATGVSFQRIPDLPYQAQGQRVSWVLMAADIMSITA